MLLYFRLLNESFRFALNALRSNRLRTILSLLGVTIGIFSIIAVLAAVDSMDHKIKSDFDGMDKNMIYLFNHSFGPSDVPQWKMRQFPRVKYEEFEYLKRNMPEIERISYTLFTRRENIKYERNTVSDIDIQPCTQDLFYLENLKLESGRFFNESESNSGAPLIILGHEVAQGLFKNEDPIGKNIRLYGKRLTVIGVLRKEGVSSFGNSKDVSAFLPANYVRQLYGDNVLVSTPVLVLKPVKGLDGDAFKAELAQKMRTVRGLKPNQDNNFFINEMTGLFDTIDSIVSKMNLVGWIISGFSLLVGGFGIANIMFVSVKERTHIIGIQKSLGAKGRFILFQFLFEAIVLSLIGGIVGMLLVWLIAVIATRALDFEFILSFKNIFLGTSLAVVIGLVSGILPALSASKLDPVEAIRSGM